VRIQDSFFKKKRNLQNNYQILFLFPLALPYLLWIVFDQSTWMSDSAEYGTHSVDLFATLINSPFSWSLKLFTNFKWKAPMFYLLGQFFVPLGMIINSVNIGLLLLQIVTLFVSLVLMVNILHHLFQDKLISITGCLTIASAPLMFGLTTNFWVEPLQLLAVVWFLFIFVHLDTWEPLFTFLQLLSATSFALLVKTSSPLYCLIPGTVVCWHILRRGSLNMKMFRTRHWPILLLSLSLSLGAVTWYALNWDSVIYHIRLSGSSPLYGTSDTFINKFIYWLEALQKAFLLEQVFYIMIFLFFLALIVVVRNKNNKLFEIKTSSSDTLMLVACIHIILFLISFTTVRNESIRFLLPILPYLVILICWTLKQLKNHYISISVFMLFVIQFSIINLHFFNLIEWNHRTYKYPLRPIQWKGNINTILNLNKILDVTCTEENTGRVNILGLNNKDLQLLQLRFFAVKKKLPKQLKCKYENINHAISATKKDRYDSDKLFDTLITIKPAYYLSLSEDILRKFLIKRKRWNYNKARMRLYQADLGLLQKVADSSKFKLIPLPEYNDLRIYKYIGSTEG
jgi:hypothetical protein